MRVIKLGDRRVASAETSPDVTVSHARRRGDLDEFIRFPYRLYASYPRWVPPLEMERRDFLDPRRNPWFEFGTAQLFLARRGGQVVGRIAAAEDTRYNAFHGTRDGVFGFFECINDFSVARALLDAAAAWARDRGHSRLLGPMSFSTNYECALLIDGFDQPPAVMMPYNPPYYPGLLEEYGFAKAKDLYAFDVPTMEPPSRPAQLAEKLRARGQITVRALELARFERDLQIVRDIYNSAWEHNWGFVPMTDHELEHLARDLRPLVRPELVLFAEAQGRPIAFSMTLPDYNEALAAAGGRLTRFGLPIGLLRLALATRKIRRVRLVTLGIVDGYRRRGTETLLYLQTLNNARKLGYTGMEISWTLEDNALVNSASETMGGIRYKTYRVYQMTL